MRDEENHDLRTDRMSSSWPIAWGEETATDGGLLCMPARPYEDELPDRSETESELQSIVWWQTYGETQRTGWALAKT